MTGTIVWWSTVKFHGIISVTENGIVQKYFMLQTRIARSPEVIKAGQFVRFLAVQPPPKAGLLPMALAVEVSDTPFIDAGAAALAGSVK